MRFAIVLLVACSSTVATDRDHDGIIKNDRCPDNPEDLDGFQDADGCPDRDDDGDKFFDWDDLCPRDAEDEDNFADDDGCSEPDNDIDRILDAADRCPVDAEIYNGFSDDDGCPDPIALDYESFTDNLFVLEPITFDTDNANLTDTAYVERLAAWLRSEPAVRLLGIIGHAEPTERDPLTLSEARAKAVADALARAGLARSRIEAHGAGTRPATEWAKTYRPPGADRSVHFRYFKLAGKSHYRWDGTIDVRVP